MMEKGLVIKPVPRIVITGLQIQNTSSICIRIPINTRAHTQAMNNNDKKKQQRCYSIFNGFKGHCNTKFIRRHVGKN
jgi:hypothetical protein